MRAVIRRNKRLVCDDIPDLTPGPGQLLVRTLACGICGSDLHALHHMEHMIETATRGNGGFMFVFLCPPHARRFSRICCVFQSLAHRPVLAACPFSFS
jgi:hypothetical protein